MKSRYKNIIILLIVIVVCFLSSCADNNESQPSETKVNEVYIDSFDYEIVENERLISNELSYRLSLDFNFTVYNHTNCKEFVIQLEGKRFFDFTIDYCNTEHITLSKSQNTNPSALFYYSLPEYDNSIKATMNLTLSTMDLIDDINNFLAIGCYETPEFHIIDEHSLTENGVFKIKFTSNSSIYYNFDEFTDSYKVVSAIGKSKSLEIPTMYNNYPVKSLDVNALTMATDLEELILPTSLTTIPEGILKNLTSLKSLSIPFVGANADGTGATYFGYLFGGTKNIPQSLEEVIVTGGEQICNSAFYECYSLKKIVLKNAITRIEENAFSSCTSLESIYIPDSVINIGISAFEGCNNIEHATIPIIVLPFISKKKLKEVTLISGERIETATFKNCSNLESIYIPESVSSIGQSAFSGCSNLKSIVLPRRLTLIEDDVFSNCSSLENIILPSYITEIGESAFYSCSKLSSIVIPASVKYIGVYAFRGCNNLISIDFSNAIEKIDYGAFSECNNLKEVYYHDTKEKWNQINIGEYNNPLIEANIYYE